MPGNPHCKLAPDDSVVGGPLTTQQKPLPRSPREQVHSSRVGPAWELCVGFQVWNPQSPGEASEPGFGGRTLLDSWFIYLFLFIVVKYTYHKIYCPHPF